MRADYEPGPIVRLSVFFFQLVTLVVVTLFTAARAVCLFLWMDTRAKSIMEVLDGKNPLRSEVLEPWKPLTRDERAVAAAIILAGRAVTNGELAELMAVSSAEASKRVARLGDRVRKERLDGRTVQISIPHLLN